MPYVRIEREGRSDWESNGGCFGFCGRHGSINGSGGYELTAFHYQIYRESRVTGGSSDYLTAYANYLNWLTVNSPWSIYFLNEHEKYQANNLSNRNTGGEVSITTDVEGHAVIGCASLARLGIHRPEFTNQWHELVKEGCNPLIAFLILYSFGTQVSKNTTSLYLPSGRCGLSDDEPMRTDKLLASDVYAMMSGPFGFQSTSRGTPYKVTGDYNQCILSSYNPGNTSGKTFTNYLHERFINPKYTTRLRSTLRSSGMGTSRQRRLGVGNYPNTVTGVNYYEIKGIAHTLSREAHNFGCFLGFGKEGELIL